MVHLERDKIVALQRLGHALEQLNSFAVATIESFQTLDNRQQGGAGAIEKEGKEPERFRLRGQLLALSREHHRLDLLRNSEYSTQPDECPPRA